MIGKPEIVPVLDILNGQLVHAAPGGRDLYKPVKSLLAPSSDPVCMVELLHQRHGFTLFYIADLDAIMGQGSNWNVVKSLLERAPHCRFWLDAGYSSMGKTPRHPGITPVMATETMKQWSATADLSSAVISLDMTREGMVAADPTATTENVLEKARGAGALMFIQMRLDVVGSGIFDPQALIAPGREEKWYLAGGVSSPDDMAMLAQAGYAGALVSTALHTGALP